MEKIKLTELAVCDLSRTFARNIDGTKILHYKIPLSRLMLGDDPLEVIKAHLERDEGPVAIELVPAKAPSNLAAQETPILGDHSQIEAALKKVHCKSTVYQYDESIVYPLHLKLLGKVNSLINKILSPINDFLYRRYFKSLGGLETLRSLKPYEDKTGKDWEKYSKFRSSYVDAPKIPLLPVYEDTQVRQCSPCTFLSVAFEEDDMEKAANALITDLKILNCHGLILGHFSMPSSMLLCDTVGSGKNKYVLYCFLFLDYTKLRKIIGIESPLNMPNLPTKLLGCKTESHEAAIALDLSESKYAIETVDLYEKLTQDIQSECINSYMEQRKYIDDTIEINGVLYSKKQIIKRAEESGKTVKEICQSLPDPYKGRSENISDIVDNTETLLNQAEKLVEECSNLDLEMGAVLQVNDLAKEAEEFLTESAQKAISKAYNKLTVEDSTGLYKTIYLSTVVRIRPNGEICSSVREGLRAICNDLNSLAEKDLIHSSLTKPSCLDLLITDLDLPKAIFCFVHVPVDRYEEAKSLVKYATEEGNVGKELAS